MLFELNIPVDELTAGKLQVLSTARLCIRCDLGDGKVEEIVTVPAQSEYPVPGFPDRIQKITVTIMPGETAAFYPVVKAL